MGGLIALLAELLHESGCEKDNVYTETRLELPGYFRPAKRWDLIVLQDKKLIAAVEFKSQIGSIGNNVNNRAEEAIGNGVDIGKAHKHGLVHKGNPPPWIGYFFLLEDCAKAKETVRVRAPHFGVDETFQHASYQRRYELLCERLVEDGVYQGACFLMSGEERGPRGHFLEPNAKLSFRNFVTALCTHVKEVS